MKKFLRTSLVAAVSLVLAGIVLAGIGRVLGGREQLDRNMDGKLLQKETKTEYADKSSERQNTSRNTDWNVAVDNEIDLEREFPVLEGDFREEMELQILHGMELEARGVSFVVKDSEQPGICLEAEGVDKSQFFVEEGTLHVKAYKRGEFNVDGSDQGTVTLYLPSGIEFGETELEIGAGEMTIESLKTEELDGKVGAGQISVGKLNAGRTELEVGMGQMNIQNAVVRRLEFEIGMGTLVFQGIVDGDIDGEVGMGSAQMDIDGKFESYNYDIEAAMGSVDLGDNSFEGLAADKYIDNGAGRKCRLSSSMGSIGINFTE